MKILVNGVAGFIGGKFIRHALVGFSLFENDESAPDLTLHLYIDVGPA